ncbi:hypothetical protein B0H17DRAFT_1180302 [Mycena rosella]|uniref:F-box domain-containing protein n=1 Tax=Mycena rosella TaxID=1033263 RepID=A0AAD7DE02_MYCRO|nr:hypothetical protein B0H17DRAFT_1180302 [Mycena rosella]
MNSTDSDSGLGQSFRLAHLLESNDPPLDSDISSIRRIISDSQDRRDALNIQLGLMSKLIAERDEMAECVRRHTAVLSAARRVPAEIVGEIFAATLPWTRRLGEATVTCAPWRLANVCRSWRASALADPFLWSSIAILRPSGGVPISDLYPLSMLESQLLRSGNVPLDVVFDPYYGDSAAEQLELIPPLILSPMRMDHFPTAPSLRKIILARFDFAWPSPPVLIPWGQITHYRGVYSVQRQLEILAEAQHLVECGLGFTTKVVRAPDPQIIILPHLRRLSVQNADCLSHITAPSLQHLFSFGWIDAVPSFLQRSSCRLTRLMLGECKSYGTLVPLLHSLPILESLFLDATHIVPPEIDSFHRTMTLSGLPSDICPNLTSLVYGRALSEERNPPIGVLDMLRGAEYFDISGTSQAGCAPLLPGKAAQTSLAVILPLTAQANFFAARGNGRLRSSQGYHPAHGGRSPFLRGAHNAPGRYAVPGPRAKRSVIGHKHRSRPSQPTALTAAAWPWFATSMRSGYGVVHFIGLGLGLSSKDFAQEAARAGEKVAKASGGAAASGEKSIKGKKTRTRRQGVDSEEGVGRKEGRNALRSRTSPKIEADAEVGLGGARHWLEPGTAPRPRRRDAAGCYTSAEPTDRSQIINYLLQAFNFKLKLDGDPRHISGASFHRARSRRSLPLFADTPKRGWTNGPGVHVVKDCDKIDQARNMIVDKKICIEQRKGALQAFRFKIKNLSSHELFPHLFSFDPVNYQIYSFAHNFGASLQLTTSLEIGAGNGIELPPTEGRETETAFL